eukprot:7305423-Pyramimonas_sp.AAC.1
MRGAEACTTSNSRTNVQQTHTITDAALRHTGAHSASIPEGPEGHPPELLGVPGAIRGQDTSVGHLPACRFLV